MTLKNKRQMAKYRLKCYDDSMFKIEEKTFWGWVDWKDWDGVVYYLDKQKALDKIKELSGPKLKITYEYPLQ